MMQVLAPPPVDTIEAVYACSWISCSRFVLFLSLVRGFGKCLLRLYDKKDTTPWDGSSGDTSVTHLGYYTDNGAYYYYNGGDAELRAVHDEAQREKIPFKYILLDSWWYWPSR
jgi:hypothetical protein